MAPLRLTPTYALPRTPTPRGDGVRYCRRPVGNDEIRLSGLAEVLGWSKGRPVGRMEMALQAGQEGLGRLEQAVKIVPPPMAGELLLHIPPEALDQSEVGRVGRQKERLQAVGIASPDLAERMAL